MIDSEGEVMAKSKVGVLTLSIVMLGFFSVVSFIVHVDAHLRISPDKRCLLKKALTGLIKRRVFEDSLNHN